MRTGDHYTAVNIFGVSSVVQNGCRHLSDQNYVAACGIESLREQVTKTRRTFTRVISNGDPSGIIADKECSYRTAKDGNGLVGQVFANDAADVIFPEYV
jgi:hypothetical protein